MWPDVSADFPVSGTCRRLRDALLGLSASTAGWLDVAVLIRQVLLEQDARHGRALALRVPATMPFPSREGWAEAGCEALPAADGKLSVSAVPWHPTVQPGDSERAAAEDLRQVYQGKAKSPGPAQPTRSGPRRSATRPTRRSASGRRPAPSSWPPRAAPRSSACRPGREKPRWRWRRRCSPAVSTGYQSLSSRPSSYPSTSSGACSNC